MRTSLGLALTPKKREEGVDIVHTTYGVVTINIVYDTNYSHVQFQNALNARKSQANSTCSRLLVLTDSREEYDIVGDGLTTMKSLDYHFLLPSAHPYTNKSETQSTPFRALECVSRGGVSEYDFPTSIPTYQATPTSGFH
jgi:hypothetical protein